MQSDMALTPGKQKDSMIAPPEEQDALRLQHMRRRRNELLLESIKLGKLACVRAAGLMFGHRETDKRALEAPMGSMYPENSTLFLGMNATLEEERERVKRKGDYTANRNLSMENSRAWADMLVCSECQGYIPYDRYTTHVLECAQQAEISTHLATKQPVCVLIGFISSVTVNISSY